MARLPTHSAAKGHAHCHIWSLSAPESPASHGWLWPEAWGGRPGRGRSAYSAV